MCVYWQKSIDIFFFFGGGIRTLKTKSLQVPQLHIFIYDCEKMSGEVAGNDDITTEYIKYIKDTYGLTKTERQFFFYKF